MKRLIYRICLGSFIAGNSFLFGQSSTNCFLIGSEPKNAEIPQSVNAIKPSDAASVFVTLTGDTIGEISKYVFGNAIAAWAGAHNNPVFVEGVKKLAPTLIRFPGGSWSNGYFWNGVPADVPDSIYDGTTYNSTTQTANKNKFWGQTGVGGWQTTTDQYYTLRQNSNVSEGLITINYGYARYGTSEDPVAQAAHLAADWVRYDNGRTKFWEIGNENAGPWEYGWMIDTALNRDGQPQIITGELYGKHFKVFVDSMKSAAAETGADIYIGGQVNHFDGTTSWNAVDRKWNEDFFEEVGDAADFYVMHNYFSTSNDVKSIIGLAQTEPGNNINFIRQDILNKNAFPKPVALTEYNMGSGSAERAVSNVSGIQAVVLICELIKNNFGLGARWLLLSGETTMFYGGSDMNYLNKPHADFYYLTYLQKFYGDHAISVSSSDSDIIGYASKFSSGETGVIIVNKGDANQVIRIDTKSFTVGEKYYIYSFTGGSGQGDFSPDVYINGTGPDSYQWGPYEQLFDIDAEAYPVDTEIKLVSPARSVQMIMIEGGDHQLSVNEEVSVLSESLNLQISPNPSVTSALISYQLPESAFVSLKVFDPLGKEVNLLVNENQNAGKHSVQMNTTDQKSGIYFCRIEAGKYFDVKKWVIR